LEGRVGKEDGRGRRGLGIQMGRRRVVWDIGFKERKGWN
jgi:hypothetical protein